MPEKIVYIVESLYKPDYMQMIHCHQINWMAENSEYEVHVVLTEKPRRKLVYELSPKVHMVNFDLNFDDVSKFFYYEKPYQFLKRQWAYRKRLKAFLKEVRPKAIITYDKREKWCLWSLYTKSHKILELRPAKGQYKKVWFTFLPIIVSLTISFFRRLFYTFPLRAMNTVVVDTEESKNSWRRTFSNVITIRPPIVDFPEEPVSKENCRVIAFGQFAREHKFDQLIIAWGRIGRNFPNWRLLLFGNGNQEPYRDMIKARRLSKLILCYPLPENRSERYAQSAVLVQAAESDIYGGPIMEAMAYGIPCIVMKAPGGSLELIEDEKNGYLINNRNHLMDLTIKLSMLVRNADYRMKLGLRARESMRKHNLDATMKRWIELLDNIKAK